MSRFPRVYLPGLLLLAACQAAGGNRLRVNVGSTIHLGWSGPPGFVLNEAAPSRVSLKGGSISSQWETSDLRQGHLAIVIPPGTPPGELALEGRIYLCQKTDARVCIQSLPSTRIEVVRAEGAPSDGAVRLDWQLKPGKN